MKTNNLFFISCLLLVFCLFGCQDEAEQSLDCDRSNELVSIDPICSFNPTTNTSVSFPVVVFVDGVKAHNEEYSFSWSSDSDFAGSAISVTYDQLPLTLTLTELATNCVAQATLDQDYW